MTTEPFLTIPTVGALSDLEHRLGVKRHALAELLQSRPDLYSPFNLQKKQHPYPGKSRRLKALEPVKYRPIDNPVKQLKDIQKRILATILKRVELPAYLFGAVAGKTLLGHAEQHIPNQGSTVVRMDISSYYPNITCTHVYFVWNVMLGCPPPVARLLTELTTFEYRLPQGAPTSPAIANIFLASIYAPVCLASERAGLTITTWVDDLIFSGAEARTVMETVRATLAANGFKMAPEKREIFGPKDEKNFTGTRLGRFVVRVPHKKMSDLRTAIFRLAIGAVEPNDLDKYRRNLCARIAHIGTIHKGDATKVRRYAAKLRIVVK
jgi:RNA-directed DNA polymerase